MVFFFGKIKKKGGPGPIRPLFKNRSVCIVSYTSRTPPNHSPPSISPTNNWQGTDKATLSCNNLDLPRPPRPHSLLMNLAWGGEQVPTNDCRSRDGDYAVSRATHSLGKPFPFSFITSTHRRLACFCTSAPPLHQPCVRRDI